MKIEYLITMRIDTKQALAMLKDLEVLTEKHRAVVLEISTRINDERT